MFKAVSLPSCGSVSSLFGTYLVRVRSSIVIEWHVQHVECAPASVTLPPSPRPPFFQQYAVTHPGRLALLVAVELPSLHMHKEDSVNHAILHAIFGDGCAAAVVGGETARSAKPGSLAVLDNRSWLVRSKSLSHLKDVHILLVFCTWFCHA